MADATDQPTISDELGAAWIAARYDGGAMPEVAFRVIDATRPAKRGAPRPGRRPLSRPHSPGLDPGELTADNPLHSIDLALHSKNARFMLTNA
ncbi:hypothetical protein [Methylobacterium aquaticum]|uniref:hypothetical protein n=1 Tax=Methylobacterium aquaticum TaxID=270351 RepID=UPI0019343BA0|nr:hypothetical protein [Methylobacterium aquaticum]QRE76806.1 hypothetical protein F1D61_27545 [Methylobacterium aquaticum]